MLIKNHHFEDYWYQLSEDVGGEIGPPKFIVMHYTAGGSAEASRDYMLLSPQEKGRRMGRNKSVYGSAHLVIGRDGGCWQIVPFNNKARHAGRSNWKGLSSLNQHSIGIEIANYGWLDRLGSGDYRRPETPVFAAEDVVLGEMPSGSEMKGWECYSEKQLLMVEKITAALLDHYPSIQEIVGHQEISPGRKFDPGPAFPMQRFRNLVSSRADPEEEDRPELLPAYSITTRLNIRGGPGTSFDKLEGGPLAAGTRVVEQEREDKWSRVTIEDGPLTEGWVYNPYMELIS
jgi:N-acetylmuramoyl-L-alanine amidase